MGGRLVTELAAAQPDRAIAVILLDAIVGDTWDRMVYRLPVLPAAAARHRPARSWLDTLTTVPLFRDPRQAAQARAASSRPRSSATLRRPWRLLGPAVSILRSPGSRRMLERLREHKVPLFVVHGDRDVAVPLATAQDAARRARGDLVVVQRRQPLLAAQGPRDAAGDRARADAGPPGHRRAQGPARRRASTRSTPPTTRSESVLYEPDALVLELTPRQRHHDTEDLHRRPRYRWKVLPARSRGRLRG